jgi:protein-tyrosine-phosphatase
MQKYLDDNNIKDIKVSSAGTNAKNFNFMHLKTLSTLYKYGIEINIHEPVRVSKELLDSYNIIIAMGKDHKKILLENFNTKSILFNELVNGENKGILDLHEAVFDFKENHKAENDYIINTINFIHDSIPLIVKKFQNY